MVCDLSNSQTGEEDGRKGGPTITESKWDAVLRRQGFTGLDISLPEYEISKDHAFSVMVSTVTANETNISSTPKDEVVVIEPLRMTAEFQALSDELINQLHSLGIPASRICLDQVAQRHLEMTQCISLVEAFEPIFENMASADFDAIKQLILKAAGVLWVTRGGGVESPVPAANLMVGLSRTIRAEMPEHDLRTVDLEINSAILDNAHLIAELFVHNSSLQRTQLQKLDNEFAIRSGTILINRLTPLKEMNDMLVDANKAPAPVFYTFPQLDRAVVLDIESAGSLDSFRWVEDMEYHKPLAPDAVEIQVEASGLTHQDIQVAMGQISERGFGRECSGVITRVGEAVNKFKPGDKVMTLGERCLRTHFRTLESMVQPIPDAMSLKAAAALPVIACTAYHALYNVARLQAGESILIHAAAGGVGQAAVILAKHLGAEVFVTVGSREKKLFLMDKYAIPEDHIFNSRTLDFAKGIKRMSGGKGVDVVLNSLSGEALTKSWDCLAMFGRFIELGKADIFANTALDMAPFQRNVTFSSVDILGICRHNLALASRIFSGVMDLVRKGVFDSIRLMTVYKFSQMETAFKDLQAGKHVGKIVFKSPSDDLVPVSRLLTLRGA